jgi:hypothetical protein
MLLIPRAVFSEMGFGGGIYGEEKTCWGLTD